MCMGTGMGAAALNIIHEILVSIKLKLWMDKPNFCTFFNQRYRQFY